MIVYFKKTPNNIRENYTNMVKYYHSKNTSTTIIYGEWNPKWKLTIANKNQ